MQPQPEKYERYASLHGTVAVVTGATGGIGRAIALELAAGGADIVVHGRRKGAAEAVVAEIVAFGRQAKVLLCDLADASALEQLVEAAWGWQGSVGIWINNAGADVLTGEVTHWSFEQKLAALWHVDVLASVRLSRCAGERMKLALPSRGFVPTIINIGWDQALQGMAGDSGEMFGCIKGAVMSFTRSLAQSLAPQVRVNCLAPGWIKTSWGEKASEYWQERAVAESLAGRWGTPEDIARAARFLASPAAEFITGQVISVNGGFRYGVTTGERP